MSEDELLKCKSDMGILTKYMQKPIARVCFLFFIFNFEGLLPMEQSNKELQESNFVIQN